MAQAAEQRRHDNIHKGLRLEYLSLAYNLAEATVGLWAGLAAGSIALIGFALDSIVEASSAGILVWRLHAEAHRGRTAEEVEKRAVRLVGAAFLALALYVGSQSALDLVRGSRPDESVPGVVLALVSLVVMPVLAAGKRAVASELDSRALQADSKQTSVCTYLSLFLLVGLVANAALGWWWADPLAGLAIALVAAREGLELWRTQDFCCT